MEPPRHKDAKENKFEELGVFVTWRFKTGLQYSVFSVCCYLYLFCFLFGKTGLKLCCYRNVSGIEDWVQGTFTLRAGGWVVGCQVFCD